MKGLEIINIQTHADDRGWVSNLLDFLPLPVQNLRNIHIVSMEPGVVRGNHYHTKQVEALCVLGKQVRVKVISRETQQTYEELIDDFVPRMYVLQPGLSHAFCNEGDQVSYLVCYTDQVYQFDRPDSHTDPILPGGE